MRSESTIVEFTSNDRICTTVSVQRMMCPIFDLRHTVDFSGQYQTMTRLASISVDNIDRKQEPMYIVISVHSNDLECCDTDNCSNSGIHRIKNVTLELKSGYDHSKVNLNFAITLSVFLAIYIFICPFLCFIEPYSEKNLKTLISEYKTSDTIMSLTTTVVPTPTSNNKLFDAVDQTANHNRKLNKNLLKTVASEACNTLLESGDPGGRVGIGENASTAEAANMCAIISVTNIKTKEQNLLHHDEENSFDSVEYEKIEASGGVMPIKATLSIQRHILRLSEMSRKQPKLVDRKMMNYPRLIIAIATFYVLPVVQLVLLYQTQLTKSGDEDSCYFNFLCMVKSGPFAAFNNIFSNIGYLLLGVMFIIIVKKRAYSYTYMRKKYPKIMATHGVPQHFGLFYTMGIGLIMEGILSAAYHVCPSYNNFQFDTSFMYIIGVISTLKLYQCRHVIEF